MFEAGDHVLAACSGGPDSMALLCLLEELRRVTPMGISVAHFDHRLRPASGEDAAFVRVEAGRRGLLFVGAARDVKAYAAKKKINLEEAARTLRYEFLRRAARKVGATKIATGHNMNDQAETLLMRLLRGTGPAGLAGIEAVLRGEPCPVVRPLLGLTRGDVEAYVAENGIPFREDESNLDRRFLRNRIRLELLPLLEREYEPRVVEHLVRLSQIIRDEEDVLSGLARELGGQFILERGARLSLDARTLPFVPRALSRHLIREFLRRVKGNLRAVSFADVEAILALGDGKEKEVTKGLVLRREKGLISLKPAIRKRTAYEIVWDGEGEVAIGPAGMRFRGGMEMTGTARPGMRPAPGVPGRRPRGSTDSGPAGRYWNDDRSRAVFDPAKLCFPLTIRSRRPGDAYRPLGAPGRKKLKEILRAKGIPRPDRDRLPVFLSRGEIIWMPGLPVAERFKIGPSTRLVFSIERLPGKSGRPERG